MARSVQNYLSDAALSCFGFLRRFIVNRGSQAVHG